MKKMKFILCLISANVYLPLLALCYRGGGPFELSVFPLALIHVIIFAVIFEKIWHHLLLSLNLMLSFSGGSALLTWLFYNNVSDDDMTIVVGVAMALSSAVILIIVTLISALIKYVTRKVSEHNEKINAYGQ